MPDRAARFSLIVLSLVAALAAGACGGKASADGDQAAAAPPPPQCSPGELPAASFAVLVDLSETWHNDKDKKRNEALLGTVGAAIVKAVEGPDKCPADIRYHIIGANSLYRQPVCYATYVPAMMSRGNSDKSLITRPRDLEKYLGETCPLLLNAKPEKETQVTAALVSALNSMGGGKGSIKRIVVFSDLKEEPVQHYDLSKTNFAGVDVILVYRALPEDQRDPRLLESRIAYWSGRLTERGARVRDLPDSGMSMAELASLLASGVPQQ